MLAVLLATAAWATGLPPMDTVRVVDPDCAPADEVSDRLFITFDRILGVCAPPGPVGDPCSYWVDAHLPADTLTVFRQGCATPLPGRFKPAGACDDRPRWVWTGRLDAGHTHTIGPDGGSALSSVVVGGASTDAVCLPESPRTDAISTPVELSPPSAPQWVAFPAEGYAVVGQGDAARLQWTPGPSLRQWIGGDAAASAISDPLAEADARDVLAAALPAPTGLEVRHQITAHRVHFEGYRKRGVPYCERVLELDLEQRIRTGHPDQPLGPAMRATVGSRAPAEPHHCGF